MKSEIWKVVVIDDSPEDRAEVRRLLLKGSDRQYQFIEAETGAAGVREALATTPDCVVLDYHLPDMDAPDVLAALTRPQGMTASPVMVLTGSANFEFGRAVLRAGAQDFLGKGWMTAESLTRAVENAVERWAMACELHASEGFNRSLMEGSADCIKVLDLEGRLLLINSPGLCAMEIDDFGPLCGQAWSKLWPADLAVEAQRAVISALAGTSYSFQAFCPTAKGMPRWWDVTVSPVRNSANGQIERLLAVSRDFTERKRAETELKAAVVAAEQAKAAAESASQAKDHFLAVLSHELRTPLNPALMAATILENSPQLPPDLREDVEMIRRNIELEARLIDDMLDLTRISRGKLTLSRRGVDGCEVLRHAIQICGADAADKHILLEVSIPRETVQIHADSARLQQVFWNLLKNAIKFTPERGRITVQAAATATGGFRVEVTDTGKGIEKDALPHIFEAFEQGGATVTKRYGGLGLGLAICKGLMQLHEGTLTAGSAGVGHGATFVVELPPVNPQEPGVADPADQDLKQGGSTAAAVFHILLVEDHQDSAAATSRLLRSIGYRVTIADCVKLALEKFAAEVDEPFDLVVSDLGLPDGSGDLLLGQLLARRPVKAIALSGYGMDSDIQKTMQAGFLAHLTKPVNARQLEEVIARILQSGPR